MKKIIDVISRFFLNHPWFLPLILIIFWFVVYMWCVVSERVFYWDYIDVESNDRDMFFFILGFLWLPIVGLTTNLFKFVHRFSFSIFKTCRKSFGSPDDDKK